MIIDYSKMDENKLSAFKGGSGELNVKMYDDGSAKIMRGRLEKGSSIGYHAHEGNAEIIYILRGKASIVYDGNEFEATAGQAHYCADGHSHSMTNNCDEVLEFFAVVR